MGNGEVLTLNDLMRAMDVAEKLIEASTIEINKITNKIINRDNGCDNVEVEPYEPLNPNVIVHTGRKINDDVKQ